MQAGERKVGLRLDAGCRQDAMAAIGGALRSGPDQARLADTRVSPDEDSAAGGIEPIEQLTEPRDLMVPSDQRSFVHVHIIMGQGDGIGGLPVVL